MRKNSAKDAAIADNFNTKKKGAIKSKEIDDLQKKLDSLNKELNHKLDKKLAKDEADDDKDVRSAFKMLKDMRGVYRDLGGKDKLLTLLKKDDKLLIAMVKELMKIESTLMAVDLRKDSPGSGTTTTFVVLKGLDTPGVTVRGDSLIDIGQIEDAINPSAAPKLVYDEDEDMIRPENMN